MAPAPEPTDEDEAEPPATGSWAVTAYICAVAVATLAAITYVITVDGLAIPTTQRTTFIVFAVLFTVGELRSIQWLRLGGGGELTVSWAFAFGLLLLGAPGPALLTVAGATALSDVLGRKPISRLVFNASQLPLSLALAHLVRQLSGTDGYLISGESLSVWWLVSIFLSAAVLFFSNGLLTFTVMALHQRVSVIDTIRRNLLTNLTIDGALLAVAPCFVVVAQRSLMLLPMGLFTATLVYRSSRAAHVNQHAATHDVLTDLLNRRAFHEHLSVALLEPVPPNACGAVVLIDLDGFKQINDQLGHHAGDIVLQEVARRLLGLGRPGLVAARLGGDEFALLLPRLTGPDDALDFAHEIHRSITQVSTANGYPLQIGASVGLALWPAHGTDLSTLLHCADVAMYEAKRNRLGVKLSELGEAGADRREHGRQGLLGDLPRALANGELILHYQPQFDVGRREVIGAEALVRWQHPVHGLLSPGEFVPVAEHTELIGALTEYILGRALGHAATWRQAGLSMRVAVNVSAANLIDRHFPAAVAALLAEHEVEPHLLEIEITENTVVTDSEIARGTVEQLCELGVRIAIDDFGTGYASLSTLRDFPVHAIKIDRSFVREMSTERGDAEIVRAVIALAQSLGIESTAEGVEDAAAYARLRQLGCASAQGYLMSRPIPETEIVAWMHQQQQVEMLATLRLQDAS